MQLPVVFKPSDYSLPPMYAWPRAVKRALLIVSLFAVIAAYIILGGGIIALLALLAEWF